jgi:hypothetical protein
VLQHTEFVGKLLEIARLDKTTVFMGAFGFPTLKPIKLYSNSLWVAALARSRPQMAETLVSKRYNEIRQKVDYTGKAAMLQNSQEYPEAFGAAVAWAFMQSRFP